ncbi:MAG: KipI family sensor histidine kinase inhibitor [Oleiphilaceae bacterium]|jgi:KipI family sensor histidine kinase inhibitor
MKVSAYCELISESNLLVRFGDQISEDLLDVIQAASLCAAKVFGHQLKDLVASYTTLLIEFDPLLISPWQAQTTFQKAWDTHYLKMHAHALKPSHNVKDASASCIEIPVYYHPSVAWDIEKIARHKGVTWQQVADYHSQKEYRVYAIGFAPGFAFMGQIDPRLETPRQTRPRISVPAGSVAISDLQTAVYPSQSPGGWNIIGRSPAIFFDAESSPAALLKTADRVRFKPISKTQFIRLGGCLNDISSVLKKPGGETADE